MSGSVQSALNHPDIGPRYHVVVQGIECPFYADDSELIAWSYRRDALEQVASTGSGSVDADWTELAVFDNFVDL